MESLAHGGNSDERFGSNGVDGMFLEVDSRRFLLKGVTYGTFAPDADGAQFSGSDGSRFLDTWV